MKANTTSERADRHYGSKFPRINVLMKRRKATERLQRDDLKTFDDDFVDHLHLNLR